jgi:Holliday junction resolvase RusA-like endonuclease
MIRAVEDGLTGVVWFDDSQVVSQQCVKRYGDAEGVRIVAISLGG